MRAVIEEGARRAPSLLGCLPFPSKRGQSSLTHVIVQSASTQLNTMPAEPPPSNRNRAIERLRTAMIEKKITQAGLADAADCHEKTIQNLFGGRTVRDQTLFDVCMVLDLDFDALKAEWAGTGPSGQPHDDETGQAGAGTEVAPIYMGGYTRQAVDHLVGSFLTLRPAFTKDNVIFAFRTDISWDENWPSLLFRERDRPDAPYSHTGRVHVPPSSQFIHLVSLTKGAMRMIVLSPPDQRDLMRGIITTLRRQGAAVSPVSAPIVYRRLAEPVDTAFGEIAAGEKAYNCYRAHLDECVDDGHARLISR